MLVLRASRARLRRLTVASSGTNPISSLVTGGAGFIGSHLVEALSARGHELLVIDDLSTGHEMNLAGAIEAGARLAVGDITDAPFLAQEVGAFEPDIVFHLAAQADVRRAVADPGFDALVNVVGTANVLEAARRAGCGAAILASTGGVMYGEGEGHTLPFAEADDAAPHTPYGTSKLGAEGYIALNRRLYGMGGMSLRFGNVYGPRQDPHGEAGVVAIFCGKLLDGEAPTVFGDGLQTRDYVFVSDAVDALLAASDLIAADPQAPPGPFNVGTGAETSVLDLLERLGEIAGVPARPTLAPARPGEILRVSLDPSAAAALMGWRAHVKLEEGLRVTFEDLRARRAPGT